MGCENIVSMKNVQKVFSVGEVLVHALRGISFDIQEGEFISILGPSGSGKSTCMNMIGCLDRPSAGDILIDGVNTLDMSDKDLALLRNETIGFVFQQYYLLPGLNVLDNVMLPLRYQGMPYDERKKRAKENARNDCLRSKG